MPKSISARTKPWTKEEIAQLKQLTRRGIPRPQIAKLMRRTVDSVDHKAKRMKIRSVRYHPR
jgi:hypothetical protein